MSPISAGLADQISATAPTTCGPAMDVPWFAPYVPPGSEESTSTPGAARSGLSRWLPSTVTGPRLLNCARLPKRSTAPTLKASSYRLMGAARLLHAGPSLPAEATTKMPAARSAATAGPITRASQPSNSGQPHELLRTCAARAGSPSRSGSPPWGNGAR